MAAVDGTNGTAPCSVFFSPGAGGMPVVFLAHEHRWFAAGREVAEAMALLSDGAFKLFIWLCLHAERRRGAVAADPGAMACALGRTIAEITTNLGDLFQEKYAGGCLTDESR